MPRRAVALLRKRALPEAASAARRPSRVGGEPAGVLAYVTGAAGFIGSHLCDRLLRETSHVVGIDNLSTGTAANLREAAADPRFTFVNADV
ncbi:MAG TPA: NAD-dependent epimerase/dehydratase family protein, partial [Dongiaceae bacterium]|nr:NAD-dependent epimerase/dehydratase family protein [Dongiaceae bacterium]